MLTILVADTNEQICKEMALYCENYPAIHLLPGVANGKDVLRTILAQKVDVLIMDIVLPELDGLSVLAAISEMDESSRPAVFAHTAFLDDRLLSELQRLNVVYCFVKPMGPEHIIPRVLQLMHVTNGTQDTAGNGQDPFAPPAQEAATNGDALTTEITRQIRAVGVPAHLRGYHYLRNAIQISAEAEDPSSIAITKDIYPQIAKQYHTRPSLVERSIRNAIEVAWTRGNMKVLHQYFGYTIDDYKGKPTNAEFIAMLADRVRMQR